MPSPGLAHTVVGRKAGKAGLHESLSQEGVEPRGGNRCRFDVRLPVRYGLGRGGDGEEEPRSKVYTDPEHVDADFKFQGEYVGAIAQPDGSKAPLGAQVRALGDGRFRTMFFAGGLPGDGWDGKTIIQKAPSTDSMIPVDATRVGDKVVVDQVYKATVDGLTIAGRTDSGIKFQLKRVDRRSPTLGAKPPAGAIVLFDGTNLDEWEKDARITPRKLLGPGATTRRKFQDFTLHVEFMISYVPQTQSIGQRPNSGVYLQQHYEIQILDSFGVVMRTHDCGVLYAQITPPINMCYPPLAWQTYDIDFTAARYDAAGKKSSFGPHHGEVQRRDDSQRRPDQALDAGRDPGRPGPLGNLSPARMGCRCFSRTCGLWRRNSRRLRSMHRRGQAKDGKSHAEDRCIDQRMAQPRAQQRTAAMIDAAPHGPAHRHREGQKPGCRRKPPK